MPEPSRVVPLRHPGRWVGAAIVLVLAAMLGHALITNTALSWGVFGNYFTSSFILAGLLHTLELTVLAMVAAAVLGTLLALMRLSSNPILSYGSSLYIWFFRGTPLLVQVIFLYNISALYPRLSFGIPFGPAFVSGNVNGIITPFAAAILALSLNEAAYMCEIVRAGILSVDPGQTEAAHACGLNSRQVMRFIVLPQAMRVIIPPTGNETIGMLKYTSLVSVISIPELLYSAELIYARTYQTIPLLVVASLWYLVVTTVLTVGQIFIERRLSRGHADRRREGIWSGLRRTAFQVHATRGIEKEST
jgi:polar amino acid transport system permease protein